VSPHDAIPDVLIAGGGSAAGAVLAARLSEDPHRRVLLLALGFARVDDFNAGEQDGVGPYRGGVLRWPRRPVTVNRPWGGFPRSANSPGRSRSFAISSRYSMRSMHQEQLQGSAKPRRAL
jgi:hypothetical protein